MSIRQTIRVMLWFREGVGVFEGLQLHVEGLAALRVQVAGAGGEGQFFFTVRAKHEEFSGLSGGAPRFITDTNRAPGGEARGS